MRSSAARSKAGSRPGRAVGGGSGWAAAETLLDGAAAGRIPPSLYIEGPSEPLKAAFLAELKAAWAKVVPEAPRARVLRAAEAGVDEILAAWQSASLFTPRELIVVLDVEDLGRSEKKIEAFAAGVAAPAGGSCLVLVESAADSARKALEPLRAAVTARWLALPPSRRELLAWGQRRLARESLTAEPPVFESLMDASEGDPLVFLNQLEQLTSLAHDGRIGAAEAATLLRPTLGADLPDFLAAVAMGDGAQAARRLGRLIAGGISEGTILFQLSNLVSGALGGWSRHAGLSQALRRRSSPADLAAALDQCYRAEAAWKNGRVDVIAALEQVTRALAGQQRGLAPAR